MYHLRALMLLLALPALIAASTVSVPQSVGDDELQRYIYEANYPVWCGTAGQAADQMRVKPTTDPAFLHKVMQANIGQCANTDFAQQNPAVWNTAVFGAAAAALLAARNEPAPDALRDATLAKNWSATLAGFTRQPGPGRPGPGLNTPTMYRTNAERMLTDATALINALQASPAPGGAPSPLPTSGA